MPGRGGDEGLGTPTHPTPRRPSHPGERGAAFGSASGFGAGFSVLALGSGAERGPCPALLPAAERGERTAGGQQSSGMATSTWDSPEEPGRRGLLSPVVPLLSWLGSPLPPVLRGALFEQGGCWWHSPCRPVGSAHADVHLAAGCYDADGVPGPPRLCLGAGAAPGHLHGMLLRGRGGCCRRDEDEKEGKHSSLGKHLASSTSASRLVSEARRESARGCGLGVPPPATQTAPGEDTAPRKRRISPGKVATPAPAPRHLPPRYLQGRGAAVGCPRRPPSSISPAPGFAQRRLRADRRQRAAVTLEGPRAGVEGTKGSGRLITIS